MSIRLSDRLRPVLGLSTLVLAGLGMTWSGNDTTAAIASVQRAGMLSAPHLISLTYGRYRPRGAPHAYMALRLSALEPHGQIVTTQFGISDGRAVIADGGCGIGGRHNGKVEIFYIPLKLSKGLHEVTVSAVGSACTSSTKTRTATQTFRVTAP
jgi:hypothetical protein